MEGKVKMYQCSGWQNLAEYKMKRKKFPISIGYYPPEHAKTVRGYTHSRNESLEDLIDDLKKDAGVDDFRYEVVEE